MKLWTWHEPEFSLLVGRVNHERSEYVQTVDGVEEAYRELAARIGTDQLIWCHTVPDQHVVLPCQTKVEWILDVPPKSILRFVDDIVWNRILGIRCVLPSRIRDAWHDQAIRRFQGDASARDRFLAEKKDSFWKRSPPDKTWWGSLFTQEEAREFVSALVLHPVDEKWVLRPACRG